MSWDRYDGKTVLITGASRGIGLEMARLLGTRAAKLVLVARSEEDLTRLATTLPCETQLIVADLSCHDGVGGVLARAPGQIDVLINNAGFGQGGAFLDSCEQRFVDMIELNVVSLMRLTRRVLPGMVERRSGMVINVGSTAGFQGMPYMGVYAATKAFVNSFSEALALEVRGTGVTVTGVCPGTTRTEFFEVANIDRHGILAHAMEATRVAQLGLDAAAKGRALSITGIGNKVLIGSQRLFPRAFVRSMLARMFKNL